MAAELPLEATHTVRRAWLTLALALTAFLVLVTSVGTGAYLYRQSAMQTREAILETRGEVLLQPKNETSFKQVLAGQRIREGDTLQTPSGVQASVVFFDGSELRLAEETLVHIAEMRASRFVADEKRVRLVQHHGWSRLTVAPATDYATGTYAMVLDSMEIEADSRPGSEETALSFELRPLELQPTVLGQTVPLEASVAVEAGTATVRAGSGEVQLAAGQRTTTAGGARLAPPSPALREYIRNGDFRELVTAGSTLWPRHWEERAGQGGDGGAKSGDTEVTQRDRDGRSVRVISFTRRVGATDNAFNAIQQRLDLPLSHFRSLRLRVDLQVIYHSLSGGGFADSEYPMTVQITYRDRQNRRSVWMRGFYTHNEEKRPVRNGELVAPGEWYTFEQDLLELNVSPAPVYLESLEIYASGHDYESAVARVSIEGE